MTRSTLLALVSAVFLVLAIALGALLARTGERSKMPSPAAERSEATDAGRARTSRASAVDPDAEGDEAAPTGASKEPAGQDEQPAGGTNGADEADGAGTDALAIRGLPPVDTGPVDDLCGALETSRSRLATSESMVDKLPWQNLDTVGAKKLRIVRDRLKKEVARYERRARARKECGEE
jgi:hypothetical protein